MELKDFIYYIGKLGFTQSSEDTKDCQVYTFKHSIEKGSATKKHIITLSYNISGELRVFMYNGTYDLEAIDVDELLRIMDNIFPKEQWPPNSDSRIYHELRDKFHSEKRDYILNKIITDK